MPRFPRLARSTGLATAVALATAAVALGLPPFTTAPKSMHGSGGSAQPEIFAVAAACHRSFDRVVIRSRYGNPNADVRYVARVEGDPSGLPVPLLGSARLHVTLQIARAHTTGGRALLPAVVTRLCPNLRQVKLAGDFEGYVSFGVGLRRRAGFRVWQTTAPNRIVIDVAH
jgi:hypothetical protein